jgi:hypothetical protein
MLRAPMTSLPSPVQSVLELFQGPLASVRFADIDAAGLVKLAAEVEAAATEVHEHEGKLTELKQALAQRQEALLVLAQQALAYARVYAEGDDALLEAVNRITLPRAAKPRRAPGKGNATRGEASSDVTDAAPASDAAPAADAANAGGDEAEAAAEVRVPDDETGATRAAAPVRSGRKGRGAAPQRAAN